MTTATAPSETTPSFKITRDWILAGHAVFTVHNAAGKHYTYRVIRKAEDFQPIRYFISLLGDSETYFYVGIVDPETLGVRLTKKSRFTKETTAYRVAVWALALVAAGRGLPAGYGLNSAGRCGRCGRELTHPDGIDAAGYRHGYGPECWKIITEGR